MKTEELLSWFKNEFLPDLATKGCFAEEEEEQKDGGNQIVENCQFENYRKGIDNFGSDPFFVKIDLETIRGKISRNVIVKFQIQDPIFREKMKMVPRFRNEIAFYNQVLEEFGRFLEDRKGPKGRKFLLEIVPKCYGAFHSEKKPETDLIILEDLRKSGFRQPESKVELDLDHCLIALKKLARLHAVSLSMKFLRWKGLERLKESFEEVWYVDDPLERERCRAFQERCARRAIDYLLAKADSRVPREYLKKFWEKLNGSVFDLVRETFVPEEPVSVVCHGDFNRNNLMFRYERGKPADARLIDFQTFVYGSPCLDLSFFVYMNTTLEFRNRHFDEIFRLYHSTLIETVSYLADVAEESIADWIPFGSFASDFERVSINAYVTVSFFLPMMMAPSVENLEEFVGGKSLEEMAEENCRQGGEFVSERIAEVIVDFYNRGFHCRG